MQIMNKHKIKHLRQISEQHLVISEQHFNDLCLVYLLQLADTVSFFF
jgi:hypothetical protein